MNNYNNPFIPVCDLPSGWLATNDWSPLGHHLNEQLLVVYFGFRLGTRFSVEFREDFGEYADTYRIDGDKIGYMGNRSWREDEIVGVRVEYSPLSAGGATRLWKEARRLLEEGVDLLETDEGLALVEAILLAPWGASGCLFITDNSHWPHGPGFTRTIWVNRRPLVEVISTTSYMEDTLSVRVFSEIQSYALWMKWKDERRAEARRLRGAQAACLSSMLERGVATPRAHGEWRYEWGQLGGVFVHPVWGVCPAHGVLAKASTHLEGASTPEERKWDRRLFGARW